MSRALDIVQARWPELAAWLAAAPPVSTGLVPGTPRAVLTVDGIQLESAYAPEEEAELQARLVPAEAMQATVYGLAQGSLVRTLLARSALHQLRLVVFNPAAARAALLHLDAGDWLRDARLELVRAADCSELEFPFAAAPSSLRLAADEATRLRDLVRLELATPYIRRHVRAQERGLALRLEANRELVRRDGDVAELFGTRPGATLRIAAAGPSLADHFERLRDGAAPLLAVDAALGPLVRAGILPDVVVTVDAHAEGPRRLLDLPSVRLEHGTLVYFPGVATEALAAWPGRRLAAYPPPSPGDVCASLRAEHPRGELFSSGSVIHPTVDLAVRMGASRVELYGADFALPGGRSHVSGSAWERAVEVGPATPFVLNADGERVPSFANLIGYLRDLERYLARHPEVAFVNAGRTGAAIAGTVSQEGSPDGSLEGVHVA